MKYNKENPLEIWKDVPGYEGIYQVSNLGRIKRLPLGKQWPYRRTHNNIRKQHIKNGYCQVNLSKNNEVKWYGVHRLVAMAFIPNPYNYPQVNHKDEDKTNNFVFVNTDGTIDYDKSNLEWCTQSYNNLWGTATERQIATRRRNDPNGESWKETGRKLSIKVAMCRKEDGTVINEFDSMTEASKMTGVYISTICNQCSGKRKSRRNYYWKAI